MNQILINQQENQTIDINNEQVQNILLEQTENQLIGINNSDTQNIDINQKDNQLIYISNEGSTIGITNVLVNGVSVVSGNVAYIIVPTKTSELENDSGYLTKETDPTIPTYIKTITLNDINNWNNKQDMLVSGTNIKTINNTSLLGSGNIEIDGSSYTAGTGIEITNDNVINNKITSYNDLSNLPTIPTKTSELINDNNFVESSNLSTVAFSGSYLDLIDDPVIPQNTSDLYNDSGFITNTVNDLTNYTTTANLTTLLNNKQDTLVSGTNIKTIKNQSIVGSGNIDELDIFNTNENVIGKWIDNSVIYRQVFNIGALVNMDSLLFSTPSMPNNANVIKIYGFCTTQTHSETFPLPFCWGSTTEIAQYVGLFYDYTNKRIFIRTNRNMAGYNAYVIIEYIKTS